MDGIFIRKKTDTAFFIIGFASGVIVSIIARVLFLTGKITKDDRVVGILFLVLGLITSIPFGALLYFQRSSFIHLSENGIRAFCPVGFLLQCSFQEISRVDWEGTGLDAFAEKYFFWMAAALIGLCVITVADAVRYSEQKKELRIRERDLQKRLLSESPLRPGKVIKTYIDEDAAGLYRVTVYGFKGTDDVFYIIETVNDRYEVEEIFESGIYQSYSEIEPDLP